MEEKKKKQEKTKWKTFCVREERNSKQYLQFFQFFQLCKQTGWQLTDTIIVDFELCQTNKCFKCASIQLLNFIVIQVPVKQNKKSKYNFKNCFFKTISSESNKKNMKTYSFCNEFSLGNVFGPIRRIKFRLKFNIVNFGSACNAADVISRISLFANSSVRNEIKP